MERRTVSIRVNLTYPTALVLRALAEVRVTGPGGNAASIVAAPGTGSATTAAQRASIGLHDVIVRGGGFHLEHLVRQLELMARMRLALRRVPSAA